MAESQSMTTEQVVAKTLIDEHADFLAEAVAVVARELMEAEIAAEIGAARGEVSPERTTHRNGYRPRAWETRVGEIELAVPRKREGSAYFPSFLEPRKLDRLVEQLGVHGMSKDRVSALCRALDEQVEAFRRRPLEGTFPYLWLDAKVVKVRDRGHVWVRLCVSDHHEGLKAAIARILACPWQRCTVHFVRDMLRHCRPAQRGLVSAALREIFNAQSYEEAGARVTEVIERPAPATPKVAELLGAPELHLP